jgi:type II secretory pathway pseudopilin PulG
MVCKVTCINRGCSGQTLVSTVIGLLIALLLLGSLAALYLFTARSFTDFANHMDLDNQSRMALDSMSRDIRQADRLATYATNQLSFLLGTNQVSFTYYSTNRTLVRATSSNSTVLLNDCDYLRFDIFKRTPTNGTYESFPTATATNCKVVQVAWACSKNVYGKKADTETVQGARIVLRKQR